MHSQVRAIVLVMLACSHVSIGAQASFPTLGATYQLDRSRFPSEVVICATERAMVAYTTAKSARNEPTAKRLLREVNSSKDFEALKVDAACTSITSFSQAKVIEKGRGAHRADFAAFPFGPMWGSPLYFGRLVK